MDRFSAQSPVETLSQEEEEEEEEQETDMDIEQEEISAVGVVTGVVAGEATGEEVFTESPTRFVLLRLRNEVFLVTATFVVVIIVVVSVAGSVSMVQGGSVALLSSLVAGVDDTSVEARQEEGEEAVAAEEGEEERVAALEGESLPRLQDRVGDRLTGRETSPGHWRELPSPVFRARLLRRGTTNSKKDQ